ncbi:MAG: AEC family transporter [Lachnospiraceae bacterium]|nr:AEC family transporter [Lachnospiraceae bacterium]
MSLSVIMQQMGVICILVFIGFCLEKTGVVDNLTSKKLSIIMVDICNPALIMSSILSGNITASHSDLLTAMVLGALFYAVLVALGFLMPVILRVEADKRWVYNMMCVYTNTGFLGIPVAKAVLPANSILYVVVINVFYSLLFYTHGVTLMGQGKHQNPIKKKAGPSLLKAINAGTVMAILSLLVFWFGLKFPPIITNSVEYIGNTAVFLSMVLLGVAIARSRLTDSIRDIRLWGFVIIRMILVPIAIVFVMIRSGFAAEAVLAICLMAAVPVGNLPLIQAEKIGEDTKLLSSAIAVTAVISIFTITILLAVCSTAVGAA